MEIRELERNLGHSSVADQVFDYMYLHDPYYRGLPEDEARIGFFNEINRDAGLRRATLQAFLTAHPGYTLPRAVLREQRSAANCDSIGSNLHMGEGTRNGLMLTAGGIGAIVAKEYLHLDTTPLMDTLLVGGTAVAGILTAGYGLMDYLRRR